MIPAPISLVVLDIDGVLASPYLHMLPQGEVAKSFSVRDGLGIELLKRKGIEVLLLTSRSDSANRMRSRELGIPLLETQGRSKGEILREWLKEHGVDPRAVVYMGDDLVDLSAFEVVGWAVAVGDAPPEVKRRARRITRLPGGAGAVRELCSWILNRFPEKPGRA